MFFRWGCKNWHITKLFHPVPMGVNSPGLRFRKSVWCEHQWQCLAAVPTEEQTRLWEIGSSALCPALLSTHRRLGNAGGKTTSSKLFSINWHLIQMVSTKEKTWFTWQCQDAHQLVCPNLLYRSRLSWNICLYHYSMQNITTKTKFSTLSYNTCLNREMWQAPFSHSDRLFGGFLRTCQYVILLTPFKNLSLVGISFPAYSSWHWRRGHGSTNWLLFLNFLVMICVN